MTAIYFSLGNVQPFADMKADRPEEGVTIVTGDGKVYVTAQDGKIIVLKSGDTLEELAVNDMGEVCIGTPAIADGQLFLRTRNKVWCIAEGAK